LAWDITSLPYHLHCGAKTLIIGSGGGRDVLTALWFGSKDVIGVELNQGIVDWMNPDCAEFSGNRYRRPEVKIHVDDGRSFVPLTRHNCLSGVAMRACSS
jgi:spermidine synthase